MGNTLAPGRPSTIQLELNTWEKIDNSTPFDYHIHTAYTDGTASVVEMAKAAVSNGVSKILFSEHVRHTSNYFQSFMSEVRSLQYSGLEAYAGVETKILDTKGFLDCSSQIASKCDAIIGSVHSLPHNKNGAVVSWSQLELERALEAEFQLARAIVTSSRAHILGHPMGMVIKHFNLQPTEYLYKLACTCRDNDKAFEVNSHYCLNPGEWIDIVKKVNCKVSFGSDAHATSGVGNSWNTFLNNEGG